MAIPLTAPINAEIEAIQYDTFQDPTRNLPAHEQQMMDRIELNDEGYAIANCLRLGHDISAWEDGSVKDSIGAHAWTVRVTADLNNKNTAEDQSTLVSLRAEHSGTLAILYFLQAICTFHEIKTLQSSVEIWIDNMEVIHQTNRAIQQHQHAKFNTLDFDL